jgi:arylsulfatase A-like enzyme
MKRVTTFVISLFILSVGVLTSAEAASKPNIILILMDDIGVDFVGAYKEHPHPGKTPNIDRLAKNGVLFRNAWSSPVCTPTRAGVMTGRYSFRTGLGSCDAKSQIGLSLTEKTLPKVLKPAYESVAVGKWHLGSYTGGDSVHPQKSGFDHFHGALYNLNKHATLIKKGNYYRWEKVDDGKHSISTTYATTENVNDAIKVVKNTKQPWFLYLAFNAPHVPLHKPPKHLHSYSKQLKGTKPRSNPVPHYKAMIEAMDTEIGRLLKAAPANTYVIIAGDNGSIKAAVTSHPNANFTPQHAKNTVYEGGINVPLIIAGPGVKRGESKALVATMDIFATVIELAGMSAPPSDSVSMVPYLKGQTASKRKTIYSEIFWPNGSKFPHTNHQRAIRNERYKLITKRKKNKNRGDEFYDLQMDPFETNNLLRRGLTKKQKNIYAGFKQQLLKLK